MRQVSYDVIGKIQVRLPNQMNREFVDPAVYFEVDLTTYTILAKDRRISDHVDMTLERMRDENS